MIPKLSLLAAACLITASAFGLPEFKLTPEWREKIRQSAPADPPAKPKSQRKVLVFSLTTGFVHWCIPHTEAVVRILGETSGAFNAVGTTDIEDFLPENLARYDAVVLNNNCPDRMNRDVFRDVLINKTDEFGRKYNHLPLAEREALATRLFTSLTNNVANGGGLIVLHGGITNFNESDEWSRLVGASFNYHPKQQELILTPVDPAHPLTRSFGGRPFVHVDEPYLFNRAYPEMNFHPLLQLDASKVKPDKPDHTITEIPRYVSWIKRHGKGRVFYCSPSHNAQSFERPELLAFMLGGIQYALGDLDCPDAPIKPGNE